MEDLKEVGLSLFQGAESILVDKNNQRHEEEEDLEDRQRRHEEIENILKNAFDDLDSDEDDCSSINSCDESVTKDYSGYIFQKQKPEITHTLPENEFYGCEQKDISSPRYSEEFLPKALLNTSNSTYVPPKHSMSPRVQLHCSDTIEDRNVAYREADFNSAEQLQHLLIARQQDIQRLSQELHQLEMETTEEKDALYRRLALKEAERDRANIQLKNTQELLVESKGKISALQKEVETLKSTVTSLEKSNQELSNELSMNHASVTDLHHKILLMERGNVSSTETLLRNVDEKYKLEISKLQKLLEDKSSQWEEKEKEYLIREDRSREVCRKQEKLILEKSEAVNQLAQQLEDSQRQLRQYLTEEGGTTLLRAQLEASTREQNRLQNQLQDSMRQIESLHNDLNQYQTLDSLGLLVIEKQPKAETGVNGKLRQELQRSLIGQKMKREEIQRLQENMDLKNKEIGDLKEQESHYLDEISKLKNEVVDLSLQFEKERELCQEMGTTKTKYLAAEEALKTMESQLAEAVNNGKLLSEKVKKLECKLKDFGDISTDEYLHFHEQSIARVREEAADKEQELVMQIDQNRSEVDRIKKLYIELCKTKEQLLHTYQIEKEEWQQQKNDLENRVTELQSRLDNFTVRVGKETERAKQEALALVLSEIASEPATAINSKNEERESCSCKLLQEKLALFEGKQQGLKEELNRKQSEVRENRSHIANLEQQIFDSSVEIEKLKAEAEVLRKSKNEKLKLQSELKDRDLELIALNAKVLVVQKLESEIQVLQNELSLLRNKYSDQEQKVAHVEKLEEECQELKQNIIELQLQAVVVPKLKAEIKILQEKSSCIQDVVKESEETYRKEFLTEEIVKLKEELKSLQEDSIKKEQRFLNDINSMKQREKDLLMKLQNPVERKDSATSPNSGICLGFDIEQLEVRHIEEIEAVKEHTVKYFATQISDLEDRHKLNLENLQKLHAETLHSLRLAAMEGREQVTALHRAKEEAEKRVLHLDATLLETKSQLQQVQTKYRSAKKAVHAYKVWSEERERHCKEEWNRVEEGYREALSQLHSKMEAILQSGVTTS